MSPLTTCWPAYPAALMTPGMRLDDWRSEFPLLQERLYLITGAIAPLAVSTRHAIDAWLDRAEQAPLTNFEGWEEPAEALRSRFAALIGAKTSDVALTDGTSRAINIAIGLLADHPGRRVLVDPTTYPSGLFPWMTKSTKELVTASAPLDPSTIHQLGRGELAAAVVSHVAWQTGYRHNLCELADATHAEGGVLIVDAAQSAGVVPIAVESDGVDVLAAPAMKWMYGIPGVAFLYVASALIDRPWPRDVGYLGMSAPDGFDEWPFAVLPTPAPNARRFELGMPSLLSVAAASAGLDLVLGTGVEAIGSHTSALVSRCLQGLDDLGIRYSTPRDPAHRAAIIAVRHPRAKELGEFLATRRIDVGGGNDWGLLRVDPAAFCVQADIDRLLDAMAEWLGTR
jgi:cysteine desulfurase / selenocysteine lyase